MWRFGRKLELASYLALCISRNQLSPSRDHDASHVPWCLIVLAYKTKTGKQIPDPVIKNSMHATLYTLTEAQPLVWGQAPHRPHSTQ